MSIQNNALRLSLITMSVLVNYYLMHTNAIENDESMARCPNCNFL